MDIQTLSSLDDEITSNLFDQELSGYRNALIDLENTEKYNGGTAAIENIDFLGNSFSSLNVLVVDDSIIQRKIMQSKLAGSKGGY